MDGTAPNYRATKRKSRRFGLIIALALAGILLVIGVVGAFAYTPLVVWIVKKEARKRGVKLKLGEVSLGMDSLVLKDSRATLEGMRGLQVEIDELSIKHDWFEPKKIEVNGVDIQLKGSAVAVALDLSEWAKEHPRAFQVPVSAEEIKLIWKSKLKGPPWLKISSGAMTPTKGGGEFTAGKTVAAGVDLGRLRSSWSTRKSVITMSFGHDDPAKALVRLKVAYDLPKPSADIELRPVKFTELSGPMGMLLPVRNATVSGKAHLVLQGRQASGPIEGTLTMTMDGYQPPLPTKIEGLSFGEQTILESKVLISEDRQTTKLTDVSVKNGTFQIKGKGEIAHHTDHATIKLEAGGSIKCADLAAAALKSQGGGLSAWLARMVVTGNIEVKIKVDADTRSLLRSKLEKSIGVGCGLRGVIPPAPGPAPFGPGPAPSPFGPSSDPPDGG